MTAAVSLSEISATRRDQLERILDAGLVRQGRVFALSLGPIQRQLGARWEAKREQVWEAVERALSRRMPPPDVFMRVDDATVLAAVASASAYDGQVRCAEVLRGILNFFLGRSAEEDVEIARVSGLSDGMLSCEALDLAAPVPAAAPRPDAGRPAPGAQTGAHWSPPLGGRSYAAPFFDRRGEPVPMVIEIAPVWRLDLGTVSAYALRRHLPARTPALNDDDREALDNATFDRLVTLLEEYQREGGMFALIAPVFFSTLSSRRSRLNLIGRCGPVLNVMRQAVIFEIEGLSGGIPAGRIRETAAMAGPFARCLTACVTDADQAEAVLREYAFHGVAVQAAQRPWGAEGLGRLISTVRRRTPNVMVHRVLTGDDEDRLRALGASHLTLMGEAGGRAA